MLYLNEGFQGGETNFLRSDGACERAVVPETGMALLFRHDMLHEGALLRGGVKYAMRSDVMFEYEMHVGGVIDEDEIIEVL